MEKKIEKVSKVALASNIFKSKFNRNHAKNKKVTFTITLNKKKCK